MCLKYLYEYTGKVDVSTLPYSLYPDLFFLKYIFFLFSIRDL